MDIQNIASVEGKQFKTISIPINMDSELHVLASKKEQLICDFTYISDARELLRTWREDVVRRSEDVVSIWEEILCDTQADLGDERWMILEQV